jgi:hypothetical protein
MYASLETDVTPQARTIGADESREEDNTGLIRSVRVRASPGSDGASPYHPFDAVACSGQALRIAACLERPRLFLSLGCRQGADMQGFN